MTKKVLISLDELNMLTECENCLHKNDLSGWFYEMRKKQFGRIAINVNGEPIVWGENEESTD